MAMRAGRAIRWEKALAHAYEKPCDDCGHQSGEHRELPPETLALVDGEVVTTPNPDYQPLHFHCGVEGCSCVMVAAAS